MVSKFCALWLVVLVLSPFTAPFSTCDFGRPLLHSGRSAPFAPQAASAATVDTNTALVPARIMTRHQPGARVWQIERTGPASSFNFAPRADSIKSIQRHEALRTILRL
jgi:hypothetical protein